MKYFNNMLQGVCVCLLLCLLLCVLWQVLSRYVLAQPSTFTEELARFLFIWLSLLGAAVCYSQKAHLAIDLLSDKLLKRFSYFPLVLEALVFLFAAGIMCVGGTLLIKNALVYQQISPVLEVSMAWVYLCIPISGVSICCMCVAKMLGLQLHPGEAN